MISRDEYIILSGERATATVKMALEVISGLILLYAATAYTATRTSSPRPSTLAGKPAGEEIISARSRFAKVYQVSADTRMMRISAEPVHYQASSGDWEEIDTRVVPSTDPNFSLQMARDDYQVYFKQVSTSPYLVRYLSKGAEVLFGIQPQQTWGILSTARAEVEANTVSYKNIYPGVDLRYELAPTQMLEEFTVTDRALASDMNAAFGVYSQGMSIVAIGNVVHLVYVGGDGSLKYNARNGNWGTAITLDASGTFWSPGLSLDTSTNTLYAAYRKSSSNDVANGSVYYKKGTSPYGPSQWSTVGVVTSAAYSPETIFGAAAPGAASPWSLSTNYSGNGVNFTLYVDGAYGLKFARLR